MKPDITFFKNRNYIIISIFLIFFFILCSYPVSSAGSVLTAGDAILKTDELRILTEADGSGIIVGVISNGAKGLSEAQKSGDLPGDVVILKDGKGSEGIAMMEIIHDIVPNATLVYHDFGGGRDDKFIEAFQNLIKAGASIIVEDVGNYEVPYFEDGNLASEIQEIIKDHPEIIIVSAAGNFADVHYQGLFHDSGDGFHSFNRSSGIPVILNPGARLKVVLQWDDPFHAATNDFDLFLYDLQSNSDVSLSNKVQTGEEKPFEKIDYQNVGDKTQKAEIRVKAKEGSGKNPVLLELLFMVDKEKASVNESFLIPDDSIFGWSALPGVISVATISADNMNIQKFSSQGHVTITNPALDIRKKPDITGVDNVDVTGSGNFMKKFTGTSAAAPHIGGLLALIRCLYPNLSTEEIRNALFSSSHDLGEEGWDTVSGHGLADALSMYKYLEEKGISPGLSPGNQTNVTPGFVITPSATPAPASEYIVTESCVLSKPGRYLLGEDIVDFSESIITIASSDIEFDGSGHTISGIAIQFGTSVPILQTGILIWSPENEILSNITLNNLCITGTYAGISVKQADNMIISNCELPYNSRGIDLSNVHNCIINENTISGSGYAAVTADADTADLIVKKNTVHSGLYGIVLDGSSSCQVLENIITENHYDGIKLDHGVSNSRIDDNYCAKNKNGGISLYSAFNNTVYLNTCELNNPSGILLHESSENIISQNRLIRNIRGINCYYSDRNTLVNNEIIGNDVTGIMLQPSGHNKILQNLIIGNLAEGILITNAVGRDQQNLISDNYFENNQNVRLQEGGNPNYIWNESISPGTNIIGSAILGGNVWTNPKGSGFSQMCQDQDGNGICDLPYSVMPGNIDEHPLKYSGPSIIPEDLRNIGVGFEPVTANDWVTEGKILMGSSDYDGAIMAYDRAIALSPTNYQAWRDKALSLRELKRYDEAFSVLNAILKVYPDNPELWSTIGDIYLLNLEQYAESIPYFEKALEIDNQDIHSLVNIAFAYDKTGETETALSLYHRALDINPSLTDAWNKAANILTRAGHYSDADMMYNKALEIDPGNTFVLNNKGYALFLAGKFPESVETLEKAVSIDPGYSSAWKNLGAVLNAMGKTEEAQTAYAQSV
ncbi:MAG: tetratricopeptide repeat protein [Methanomicrobiales archaeon]|nr:tetratricopeptide repeat protein [Methanomicrobiales archaeon]